MKDSHRARVTCLQWSRNAMKLFSGDSKGLVVCTEIDYESVCTMIVISVCWPTAEAH